jgi:membrane protein implicated in regulation of membrane protease activity
MSGRPWPVWLALALLVLGAMMPSPLGRLAVLLAALVSAAAGLAAFPRARWFALAVLVAVLAVLALAYPDAARELQDYRQRAAAP